MEVTLGIKLTQATSFSFTRPETVSGSAPSFIHYLWRGFVQQSKKGPRKVSCGYINSMHSAYSGIADDSVAGHLTDYDKEDFPYTRLIIGSLFFEYQYLIVNYQ